MTEPTQNRVPDDLLTNEFDIEGAMSSMIFQMGLIVNTINAILTAIGAEHSHVVLTRHEIDTPLANAQSRGTTDLDL